MSEKVPFVCACEIIGSLYEPTDEEIDQMIAYFIARDHLLGAVFQIIQSSISKGEFEVGGQTAYEIAAAMTAASVLPETTEDLRRNYLAWKSQKAEQN